MEGRQYAHAFYQTLSGREGKPLQVGGAFGYIGWERGVWQAVHICS
jgi:hypothetical protein